MSTPKFQMPFPCNQKWTAQTRKGHSPQNAVDLNRPNDHGDTVVASADGKVVTVKDLGNRSYGKYVIIEHTGGWDTLYAHLSKITVKQGQKVSMGTKIGEVGNTGNSSGAHLHYEQRKNKSPQKIKWNGSQILYWGTRQYTSKNCKGSGGGGGGGVKGTVKTKGANLNVRSGPGTKNKIVGKLSNGSTVTISCQTTGETITGTYGKSNIWNKIGTGKYIPDAYTYTGSSGFVAPKCKSDSGVKGTVKTKGANLNVRSGPGTKNKIVGKLSNGSTVTISCQTTGETITGTYGKSNIWNKIGTGKYIPDAYTYTGSNGFVAPKCK